LRFSAPLSFHQRAVPATFEIRTMCRTDLPRADELRRIAGWNQRPADWDRFLKLSPEGCFVAVRGDVIAGTVTTICYGREVAWIGMLLVHPEFRGGGIGKALLTRAVGHLQNEKIGSIKLDATPAGEGLYRKMGFRDEWALTRYKTTIFGSPGEPARKVEDLVNGDSVAVSELDGEAFGIERPELLESLLKSAQDAVALRDRGKVQAFGLVRVGSVADYFGPVAARTERAGTEVILELARRSIGRTVYWDIPSANKAATVFAEGLGFSPERPLLRMYLGGNEHSGDVRKYFAIADPSLG
jgi:GNAT superfamily N-acetyltransferase